MTVYTTHNVYFRVKEILFFPNSLYTGLLYEDGGRTNIPTKFIVKVTQFHE